MSECEQDAVAGGMNNKQDQGGRRPIKITVVGDGTVGKTCLLISYTTGTFPEDYVPTVFDNYGGDITVDDQKYSMALWDTAGQEEYERLRPLSYPSTDVFILCFSVTARPSFDNIPVKWIPELRHHCKNVPILLVGTKVDLREGANESISTVEGRKMKTKIDAAKYVECSAKTKESLVEVFEEAVRAATSGRGRQGKRERRVCTIL